MIVVLTGGTGGAKFVEGLRQRLPVYPEFLPAVTARPGLLSEKVKAAADGEGYARKATVA